MRTIYRHEIPVDDEEHVIEAHGGISGTGNIKYRGNYAAFEVWAEHDPAKNRALTVKVYGTGHEIPENAVYLSTGTRDQYGLVFHLYELMNE
jgi:hypothetical protein